MISEEHPPEPHEPPLELPLAGVGKGLVIVAIGMLLILGLLSLFVPLGPEIWVSAAIAYVIYALYGVFRQLFHAVTGF